MLDPCEVAHRQGDLAVDRPYDAREHDSAHYVHVSDLAAWPEGMAVEDDEGEEEHHKGGVEPISHPTEYPSPVEEQVSWPLLV